MQDNQRKTTPPHTENLNSTKDPKISTSEFGCKPKIGLFRGTSDESEFEKELKEELGMDGEYSEYDYSLESECSLEGEECKQPPNCERQASNVTLGTEESTQFQSNRSNEVNDDYSSSCSFVPNDYSSHDSLGDSDSPDSSSSEEKSVPEESTGANPLEETELLDNSVFFSPINLKEAEQIKSDSDMQKRIRALLISDSDSEEKPIVLSFDDEVDFPSTGSSVLLKHPKL